MSRNEPDFTIKQNDTAPPIQIVVRTGLREEVDLTGAINPEFHMWDRRTRTVKVDAAAEITSPTAGLLSYSWAAADTDTPGLYQAEFQFDLPDGEGTVTIPNDGYYLVQVVPEIS